MRHYEAIIFDMDGVIVDSEPLHERAFCEVFLEMGYGEDHGMEFTRYLGRSDRALWLDFIDRHHPAQSLEELLAWKQNRLIEIVRREQPIFPAVPELLVRLEPHYHLALASGSNHAVIDAVLEMKQLRRFFPVIVSVQDVGRGKPAPDVFLLAAERLAVAPECCCVIEDSPAGVAAALAAGMEVIAITNTLPRETLSRATAVVDDYESVERLLLPSANGEPPRIASTVPKVLTSERIS